MIHNVEAIYDQGVFRPVQPLALPEGTRVHLRVEEENGTSDESSTGVATYHTWLTDLAGSWQGNFVRGKEGDFETREPLS